MGKHGYGTIRKSRGKWQLRYYIDEPHPDKPGEIRRRQIAKILAPVCDQYRKKTDVQSLADDILVPLRRSSGAAEGSLTIAEFTDRHFLPFIQARRKPSTGRFYQITFDLYIRDRAGFVRLREFTTRHAQGILDAINLSHQSLLRIKTTMSAIFSYALRLGFINGVNPVRESKAEGKVSRAQGYAYTLDEVSDILGKLSGRAKVAVAIAAFAGLRESEIRGLQWSDYDGQLLHVRRALWRTHVNETKTPASTGAVPVIAPLKKILDGYRVGNGASTWILAGDKKRFSLNLDNLCRREIKPVIGVKHWHGWHGFRRGLMTNMFELGVPPEIVQTILRHADASTSRKFYLVLESTKQGLDAMRKLEKALAKKEQLRSSRATRSARKPHKH